MVQRLDTAFSRALLDGKAGVVVDASVLEQTLQQQLLHGGTLDTLLLEMGLLDEAQVQRALSLAWNTEPIDPRAFETPDPAACKLLPERMAVALGTAPLHTDADGALHVALRGPLDKGLVTEIAALIKIQVVAHVVPEVRVWQALFRAYGTPLDERFQALLRMLDPLLPIERAGPSDSTASSSSSSSSSSLAQPSGPMVGGDDPVVSWDLVEAMAHLAAQDSRDGIARVATSFARRFLPFAAVFGVRANACVGWHRQGPAEGVLFSARPFAISRDCVLHTALASPSPHLGKPQHSDGNSAFFGWLGRRRPKSILLVPIVVARRPVACLFADGGMRPRDPRDLGELTAFAARLGPAFEALLRQRHRQHPSLFPQAAADPDTAAGVDTAADVDVDVPSSAPSAPASSSSAPWSPASSPASSPTPARRDGTSPFARSYVPPPPPKKHAAAAAADDDADDSADDDRTPLVLNGIGTPLPTPLPAPLPAVAPPEGHKSTLFTVDDTLAPAAWQEALQATIELGLQGGSVTDRARILAGQADDALDEPPWNDRPWEDGPWDDVVYDASHARELDAAGPAPSRVDRVDLSFPELSTSTLAGLYGRDGGAAPDADPRDADRRPATPTMIVAADAGEAEDEDKADYTDDVDDDLTPSSTPPKPAPSTPPAREPPLSTLSHRDVVELLFAGDDDLVGRAKRELVSRGLASVPALSERFPGRLRVDPFDPGENVRSAERTGPLLDVLARLGRDGLDAAIPHVDSRYPAHRFAAVLLFSLTPDPRAIDLLRARLHDQEPRIRELAAEALMPFLAHPRFEALLVHLRERTSTSSKPYPMESRRRAVQLLGQFRDVGAVPLLIALLAQHSDGDLADDTRRALRAIALQDFGNRPKGWEKWWGRAKKRSRLDWLIDGLASEELELRQDAHRELASLAGDDFGYRPDADKRSRQRAIEVWQQWWTEERARAPQPSAVSRI